MLLHVGGMAPLAAAASGQTPLTAAARQKSARSAVHVALSWRLLADSLSESLFAGLAAYKAEASHV